MKQWRIGAALFLITALLCVLVFADGTVSVSCGDPCVTVSAGTISATAEEIFGEEEFSYTITFSVVIEAGRELAPNWADALTVEGWLAGYTFTEDRWSASADGASGTVTVTLTRKTDYLIVDPHGISVSLGDSITRSSAMVRLVYDANGGSGPVPADGEATPGANVTLCDSPLPTRRGDDFVGWDTDPTAAANSARTGGSILTVPADASGTLTLYAIWTPKVWTLNYSDLGALSGLAPTQTATAATGGSFVVSGSGTLARTGYAFLGWSLSADAAEAEYLPGDTLTLMEEILPAEGNTLTLYPVWSDSPYTLTLDTGGTLGCGVVFGSSSGAGSDTTIRAAAPLGTVYLYLTGKNAGRCVMPEEIEVFVNGTALSSCYYSFLAEGDRGVVSFLSGGSYYSFSKDYPSGEIRISCEPVRSDTEEETAESIGSLNLRGYSGGKTVIKQDGISFAEAAAWIDAARGDSTDTERANNADTFWIGLTKDTVLLSPVTIRTPGVTVTVASAGNETCSLSSGCASTASITVQGAVLILEDLDPSPALPLTVCLDCDALLYTDGALPAVEADSLFSARAADAAVSVLVTGSSRAMLNDGGRTVFAGSLAASLRAAETETAGQIAFSGTETLTGSLPAGVKILLSEGSVLSVSSDCSGALAVPEGRVLCEEFLYGYRIYSVENGEPGSSSAVLSVSADVTEAGTGTVSPSNRTCLLGEAVELKLFPGAGYTLDRITINGIDRTAEADFLQLAWVFRLVPTEDTQVLVSFRREIRFPDVPERLADGSVNWQYAPVAYAAEKGLVTGFEDGTFRPDDTLTAGQYLTVLYRLVREAEPAVYACETEGENWTEGARWLDSALLGGTFSSRLAEPLTRAETAFATEKALKAIAAWTGFEPVSHIAAGFGDVASDDPYADSILWLQSVSGVRGYDTGARLPEFRPEGRITRAEAAQILLNISEMNG